MYVCASVCALAYNQPLFTTTARLALPPIIAHQLVLLNCQPLVNLDCKFKKIKRKRNSSITNSIFTAFYVCINK